MSSYDESRNSTEFKIWNQMTWQQLWGEELHVLLLLPNLTVTVIAFQRRRRERKVPVDWRWSSWPPAGGFGRKSSSSISSWKPITIGLPPPSPSLSSNAQKPNRTWRATMDRISQDSPFVRLRKLRREHSLWKSYRKRTFGNERNANENVLDTPAIFLQKAPITGRYY